MSPPCHEDTCPPPVSPRLAPQPDSTLPLYLSNLPNASLAAFLPLPTRFNPPPAPAPAPPSASARTRATAGVVVVGGRTTLACANPATRGCFAFFARSSSASSAASLLRLFCAFALAPPAADAGAEAEPFLALASARLRPPRNPLQAAAPQ